LREINIFFSHKVKVSRRQVEMAGQLKMEVWRMKLSHRSPCMNLKPRIDLATDPISGHFL
jgi:hypothetical protein